jgi:hypothetical protein
LRSTKITAPDKEPGADTNYFAADPPSHKGAKTHHVFAVLVDVGKVYGDLTGSFPVMSSRGHHYILTLYDHYSNTISNDPMKNITDKEMIRGYTTLHQQLMDAGLKPELKIMDNECSRALRQYLTGQNIDLQMVQPHLHRQNVAERAIQTFKNHCVAGICSVDRKFPMHLWCEILPQATLTLNLLRTSRINPSVSAITHLFGKFDFNRTPLAPPVTRAVAHVKPKVRKTGAPHGEYEWYIGPAMYHYRCYRVWMTGTNKTIIVDTLELFPQHVKMPNLSTSELAIQAARELTFSLRNPSPAAPFAHIGHEQHAALQRLATIFK